MSPPVFLSNGLLLCTLVTVLLLSLLGWRMAAEPMQVYGDGGAQYIEHSARLEIQEALGRHQGSLMFSLRLADDTLVSHPPGLHLATLAAVLGRVDSAEASLWTAPLWLLLLALALAWVARQLSDNSGRAASAAFIGTLLLPAAHGAATRVHYDLPMTALLWGCVATLIWAVRSRPVVGGLATGLLFILATQIKWTAAPFAVFMLCGAWLSALRPKSPASMRRAQVAAFVSAAVGGGLILAYLSTKPTSFAAGSLALEGTLAAGQSLPWYLLSLVTSVYSPIGSLLLAPLLFLWATSDRRAAALISCTVVGHLAFLVPFVTRPDERFLLTLAPALILAAALAWSNLNPQLRRRLAATILVLLAVVALEFHLAPSSLGLQQGELLPRQASTPAVGSRGPFLADSFERRGWSSRASTPLDHGDLREVLWSALQACSPMELAVEEGPAASGDVWWFRYRSKLAELRGRRSSPLIVLAPVQVDSARFWWPNPDTIPDSPSHFEPRGYSLDWVHSSPPGDGAPLPPEEALVRAGLKPSLLTEFQPQLGLARLPLQESSAFHSNWTLVQQVTVTGSPTLGLFGRGELPASCGR
jgi:hypothetical protein